MKIQELEQIINQIQQISIEVDNGEVQPVPSYIQLKKIAKVLGEELKKVEPLAYSDFDNYDLKDLPYNSSATHTVRTTINYKDIETYKQKSEEIKKLEELYKNAVEQDKKGLTCVNEDGELVEVPSYTQKGTFVLKFNK